MAVIGGGGKTGATWPPRGLAPEQGGSYKGGGGVELGRHGLLVFYMYFRH